MHQDLSRRTLLGASAAALLGGTAHAALSGASRRRCLPR